MELKEPFQTFPSHCDGGLITKLCPTLMIPWTVAHQAPLFMVFPRQEHWSGLPFPTPDLPGWGIKPTSASQEILLPCRQILCSFKERNLPTDSV